MSPKFTRRRFLTVLGAGAACLAVTGSAVLALLERVTKVKPLHTPTTDPLRAPKLWPLPEASPANPEGPWAFNSRPDLGPPAVEVRREAHDDTASGYVFVSPQEGDTGQGGSLIVDDGGQVAWFRPLRGTSGRAMNFGMQTYRGEPVLTWGETPGGTLSSMVPTTRSPASGPQTVTTGITTSS